MLLDVWNDHGKGLAGTRGADQQGGAKRVDDIQPAFMRFSLVVIAHRNVDRPVRPDGFSGLLKGFILDVEPVLQQIRLDPLRHIVQGDMDEDGADE